MCKNLQFFNASIAKTCIFQLFEALKISVLPNDIRTSAQPTKITFGATVTTALAAGDTINGRFTHVSTDASFKGWGYANKLDGNSPHIF